MLCSRRIRWAWLQPGMLLTSCWSVGSADRVAGVYELRNLEGDSEITLEVRSDRNYVEGVVIGGSLPDRRSGKWWWVDGSIGFESLWIPRVFAPDYIIDADTHAQPGMPKLTEPWHWTLPAEVQWGQTTLSVFPDVEFRMVRRLHR